MAAGEYAPDKAEAPVEVGTSSPLPLLKINTQHATDSLILLMIIVPPFLALAIRKAYDFSGWYN